MYERIKSVTSDLERVATDARERFSGLSSDQLNWKPAEKRWSVGQCFDHLITTHSLYLPLFERLAKGETTPTFWERASPFSRFFGRYLIRSLSPDNEKKMKTSAKALPSTSEIDGRIIQMFCDHQNKMIEHLQKLSANVEPAKMIITSPLVGIVTYSLDDCFTILVVHCQRHYGQAKHVTEAKGFPVPS